MSNFSEMKDLFEHLSELGSVLKERLSGLSGEPGQELRRQAKAQGKKIGAGVGMALAGLGIALTASLYIILVLILLLNIALDRLWLSALIVVFALIFFGGVLALLGVKKVQSSVKGIPKVGGDVLAEIRQASEEMKKTMNEIQEIAKKEKEERERKMKENLKKAKTVAPYIVGAYAGYRILKKVVAPPKAKRIVLEEWEES